MIADMHCHYPMHVLAKDPPERWQAAGPVQPSVTFDAMTDVPRRPGWVNKLRSKALRRAADVLNYRDGEWRVSLEKLVEGDVRAVFSVLYEPFAEIDLTELPGSDPEQGYFGDLTTQLTRVEAELAEIDPDEEQHEIVTTSAALDSCIEKGKVAFMHCVEGGFHLGGDLDQIDKRVGELADRGVVYITVSHLFWRGVAGNAPALPFLSDRAYNRIFFLWSRRGLTKLGVELIKAMYRHGIMIDVSHMNQQALDQTFALLDRLDRRYDRDPHDYPVIASHAGYRFGDQAYMLAPDTIRKIAKRGGVIGLILAQHQLNDGREEVDPESKADTWQTVRCHVKAIHDSIPGGSYDHVAIGSDLDGFIKPTVAGIETVADLPNLQGALAEAYDEEVVKATLSGNALRVVKRALDRETLPKLRLAAWRRSRYLRARP